MTRRPRHQVDPLPPVEAPDHMRLAVDACDAQAERIRRLITRHNPTPTDVAVQSLDAINIIRQAAGAPPCKN